MVHHEISAALARERVSTYLADAEAARRARQARPGRAAMAGWLVSFGRRLSQAQRPRRLYGNQPRLRRAGRSA
jgi:hypothetical protein